MSQQGYIKLFREIQGHWIYDEKRTFSKYEAWLDLLMMVNHKDNKVMMDGKLEEVKRGQRITSERQLAEKWGWSRTKVRNFLDLLKQDEMIFYEKRTSKNTVITIANYHKYQGFTVSDEDKKTDKKTTEEPQKNHRKTTEEPQKDLNNNEKNDKHEKKNKDDDDKARLHPDKIINALLMNEIITKSGINHTLAMDLTDIEENFGFDDFEQMVLAAITDSARSNASSWKYVYNKLFIWKKEGYKKPSDVKEPKLNYGSHKKKNEIDWDNL